MSRTLLSLAVAVLVTSLLAACAIAPPPTPPTPVTPVTAAPSAADVKRQAAFDKSQDGWTGATVQELVAKLGPPTSKKKLPDGTSTYVYERSAKSGATTTFSCVVRYVIDARNARVTGHQIEGC